MKKFNYNPVAPEKNNNKAYTDDELYEFIKSAEGYLEVATTYSIQAYLVLVMAGYHKQKKIKLNG